MELWGYIKESTRGKKAHQITKITLHSGHNAQHEARVWSWVLCATPRAWPWLLEAQLLLFYCFPFHSQSSQLHFCHPHPEGSHPTKQAGQEAVVFIISLKWIFQHSSSRESRHVGGPQKPYNHWEPPIAQPFLLYVDLLLLCSLELRTRITGMHHHLAKLFPSSWYEYPLLCDQLSPCSRKPAEATPKFP